MRRLVLDTDVVVAGLRSDRGASRCLLEAAFERRFFLLVSVPVMLEYEAVLTRPEHVAEIGLDRQEIGEVLDGLCGLIDAVQLRYLWRPRLVDPADEMVLETAINGEADLLVTFNLKHMAAAAAEFGIRAVRPGEAWRFLQGGRA